MTSETISQFRQLVASIAKELVFAEAGKDTGLLPINYFLFEMEEAKPRSMEPFPTAIQQARRWLDQILEGEGVFNARSIKQLSEWTEWWDGALGALEHQGDPPALPAWSQLESDVPLTARAQPDGVAAAAEQEPILVLEASDDHDLLKEFLIESEEHLACIENGILVLEEHPDDAEILDAIFRSFHTLKGGAGFLHLSPIETLAHQLESLLDLARQRRLQITRPLIDLILEGSDRLKQAIGELAPWLAGGSRSTNIVVPIRGLLARVRAFVAGSGADQQLVAGLSDVQKAPPVPISPAQDDSFLPATVSVPEAAAIANTAPVIVPETPALAAAAPPPASPAPAIPHPASPSAAAVKVDTVKLDSLIDLVGEMVIAQSMVVQNPHLATVQNEQLTRDLAQLCRISKELQRLAMSLRMVPIRGAFQKMQRVVRDIAAKVGKQVELVTSGEDTELDRTIVEAISDPLVHMIRNAVDHGIEKPSARRERGKPEQGVIRLSAFHEGGNIVIEIRDDGNGLDRDRILRKAIEQGLVKPDEQFTDSQVHSLIMLPGFSTAERVTDVSGRGVGMDVVCRNIERLHGKIEVQSTLGQGSTFSIYLPLTLAIIDGLLIGVGDQRYILPTLTVRESFRPSPDMISSVQGRGEMVNVRGRIRPLLRLHSHLGITPSSTNPAESIVLVVESGNNARCVLVDRLLGKQEVVVKSLGDTFGASRMLAGAAILGDGRVGLILDPQSLVNLESSMDQAA